MKLREPVEDFGKEVKEIILRPPKAKDLRKCGMPIKIAMDETVLIIPDIVARYIERLGGVSKIAVDDLGAADFLELQKEVLAFFEDTPVPLTGTAMAQAIG